ncbi:Protein phosphatase 1 regulatory subunit [Aphelenchoides fujianensis]|nr:Protein phosphatase 1 regulatory subunit [Aphelenchoides fujianensis]
MASSQQTNNEDDQLECPICMDEFDDPRVLPCGHSLCNGCLETLRRGASLCPVCRGSFASTHSFPPNYAVSNHRCSAPSHGQDAILAEMEAMNARLEQAEDEVLTLQQLVRSQADELEMKGNLVRIAEQEVAHAARVKKELQKTIQRQNAKHAALNAELLECKRTLRAHLNDTPNPQCTLKILFGPPALDRVKFGRKLEGKRVALEHVLLNERSLTGTIKVANISFQKRVYLRCTSDAWETSDDVEATFHASVSPAYDSFTFAVMLPLNTKTFEFCICYRVGDGEEFWDSNDGQNYKLVSANTSV